MFLKIGGGGEKKKSYRKKLSKKKIIFSFSLLFLDILLQKK
jgi:hypothetical protein